VIFNNRKTRHPDIPSIAESIDRLLLPFSKYSSYTHALFYSDASNSRVPLDSLFGLPCGIGFSPRTVSKAQYFFPTTIISCSSRQKVGMTLVELLMHINEPHTNHKDHCMSQSSQHSTVRAFRDKQPLVTCPNERSRHSR
jgi:hypothetical protein